MDDLLAEGTDRRHLEGPAYTPNNCAYDSTMTGCPNGQSAKQWVQGMCPAREIMDGVSLGNLSRKQCHIYGYIRDTKPCIALNNGLPKELETAQVKRFGLLVSKLETEYMKILYNLPVFSYFHL